MFLSKRPYSSTRPKLKPLKEKKIQACIIQQVYMMVKTNIIIYTICIDHINSQPFIFFLLTSAFINLKILFK